MTIGRHLRTFLKFAAVAAAVTAGGASMGATDYDFAVVAKDDRPPSPADCRDPDLKATSGCLGVVLPSTETESFMVMPGLTVVEQVKG